MEILPWLVLTLFTAYFLGAVPSSVWVGKTLFGLDVRQYGSKNPGATNTFRVLGKKAGILVLFIDITKGFLAVNIPVWLASVFAITLQNITLFCILAGIVAVLGHIFSVFIKFKGGKGVATLLGMLIGLHPQAALICLVVFLIMLIITKFVSLSSMTAALVFPAVLFLPPFEPEDISLKILAMVTLVLVIFTHRSNISRLRKGEESKIYLWKGLKSKQ